MNHEDIRAGGGVRRYHTRPLIGEQTVASHSWGVAAIIIDVTEGHEKPSFELMRAALFHDVAEHVTGDIPATAKWRWPSLKAAMDSMEAEVETALGIRADGLSKQEMLLLKAADMMELLWFCVEQRRLGNHTIYHIFKNGCTWMEDKGEEAMRAFPRLAAMYKQVKNAPLER